MQLNYKESGQGQAFIILHGLLGSLDNWATLGKKFAENYRVFLLDQRNHGKSPWSDTWSYEAMAEDLHEFIQEHSLDQIILLGHSMGGKTAMFFATQFPDIVDRLLVADIAPKAYPVHHDQILHAMDVIGIANLSTRQEVDQALAQYIPDFGTRQFILKNLQRDDNGAFSWKVNLEVIKAQIESVGEALPENAFFEGDTLFLKGDKSNYILDQDLPLIQKHFPHSNLVNIHNAGHWLHAEQPEAFYTAVQAFLSK